MGTISDRRQAVQLFARRGPVVHLRDAQAGGVSRQVLVRMAGQGELLRIAKSAFVEIESWHAANDWEQFRQKSIGFGMCIAAEAHLTGSAALILLGLPTIGRPPALPTAIRGGDPHTGHDRSPFGTVRRGYLPPFHRTQRAAVQVVGPAFAAIDIARHQGPVDGLVVADAVLHQGTEREVLFDLLRHMTGYPGVATARWVVDHADGRAESPLETLGRYSFLAAGQPAPLSNVWILTKEQWFRVDHLLPDSGVILEADGALKYNNRSDADTMITSQNLRADLLRGAGFAVARYNWREAIGTPWVIPRRARETAKLRPPGPPPTCWMLDGPRG